MREPHPQGPHVPAVADAGEVEQAAGPERGAATANGSVVPRCGRAGRGGDQGVGVAAPHLEDSAAVGRLGQEGVQDPALDRPGADVASPVSDPGGVPGDSAARALGERAAGDPGEAVEAGASCPGRETPVDGSVPDTADRGPRSHPVDVDPRCRRCSREAMVICDRAGRRLTTRVGGKGDRRGAGAARLGPTWRAGEAHGDRRSVPAVAGPGRSTAHACRHGEVGEVEVRRLSDGAERGRDVGCVGRDQVRATGTAVERTATAAAVVATATATAVHGRPVDAAVAADTKATRRTAGADAPSTSAATAGGGRPRLRRSTTTVVPWLSRVTSVSDRAVAGATASTSCHQDAVGQRVTAHADVGRTSATTSRVVAAQDRTASVRPTRQTRAVATHVEVEGFSGRDRNVGENVCSRAALGTRSVWSRASCPRAGERVDVNRGDSLGDDPGVGAGLVVGDRSRLDRGRGRTCSQGESGQGRDGRGQCDDLARLTKSGHTQQDSSRVDAPRTCCPERDVSIATNWGTIALWRNMSCNRIQGRSARRLQQDGRAAVRLGAPR